MIRHNWELYQRELKIDNLRLHEFGSVVYRHSDVGLIFGNGNHTDFWIVRVLEAKGQIDDVISQLRQRAEGIGLSEVHIQQSTADFNESDKYYLMKLGIHEDFFARNDIIVIQHFGNTDAGWDPRSH